MSKIIPKIKEIYRSIGSYWLLLFYFLSFCFLEFIYRFGRQGEINSDFMFAVLFSIVFSIILFTITHILPQKIHKIAAVVLTFCITMVYITQFVYYKIFNMPLCLYSLVGAKDAMQFTDVMVSTLYSNIVPLVFLCMPLIFLGLIFFRKSYNYKITLKSGGIFFALLIASYIFVLLCINSTGDTPASQRTIYYSGGPMELAVDRLGLMPSVFLDIKHLFTKSSRSVFAQKDADDEHEKSQPVSTPSPTPLHSPEDIPETIEPLPYNMMELDFCSLIENENNKTVTDMHKYFSSISPTQQNDYTGLFEGCNLIFITAEAFSSLAIDKEITPTLYRMSREGFVFNQFYNPIWGVSTSDGEYVACTSLLPKRGVWSFSRSSSNFLPFTMGNQLKDCSYTTKAYHNHSYTYYDRHRSHPNMGYEFMAVGNGLEIADTWPESDLEMMEETLEQFIDKEPFHIYYMTISGHLQYNFAGNYIARKNKESVEHLPYGEAAKAYLACQKELDMAVEYLIDGLEKKGALERTVFVVTGDHYPYGLPKGGIDELAGHRVEDNFELYKSTLIIWKSGMEPIVVDKPCSSLDILPTLSNFFGFDYDSRLLMGRDIFSKEPPLVLFNNKSWITEKACYNSRTDTVVFNDGLEWDEEYIKSIHRMVSDKFKYSEKILDMDYYNIVFGGE